MLLKSKSYLLVHRLKITIHIICLTFIISSCSILEKSNNNQKINSNISRHAKSLFIEACTEKLIGDYQLADSLFNECIKIDNNCSACYFELSGIYKQENKIIYAINSAKKALELDAENIWYKSNLAVLYKSNKEYKKASELFKVLAEQETQKYEYLYSLAECYELLGSVNDAIEIYDKIEEVIGLNEELIIYKHRLYLKNSKPEKAIVEINKLIVKNPEDVRFYGVLAELYEQIGKKHLALENYKKILSIDSNNSEVHLSLFQYYMLEENVEKAISELKIAFKAEDINVNIKGEILINLFSKINKYPSLILELKTLSIINIKVHPLSANAHVLYAEVLLQNNKLDSALIEFRKATSLDESRYSLWNEVINLEIQLLKYKELEEDSKKALALFPLQVSLYLYNGLANIKLYKNSDAIKVLKRGKDLVVDDNYLLSDFYQYLGNAYHNLDNNIASNDAYENSLKYNPHNIYVLNNYSYYLANQNINLEKAEELILRAINLMPDNVNFMDTYGWILINEKRYVDAEKWIYKALENNGNESGIILEHYADVLFLLGRKEEAIDFWKKAAQKQGFSDKLNQKISEQKYIK